MRLVPERNFVDLTNEEVKRIVTDIFAAKKVTNIKRSKRNGEITCTIYTEWQTTDDDGTVIDELIPDELTLMNPFEYGYDAIQVDFQKNPEDYKKLKQFCFANGVYGKEIDWIFKNPYEEII